MTRGESSTDKPEAFISIWQYIRDGAIAFMGLLAIIMQAILMTKFDISYKGAGIWFGVIAILSGCCGILANRKRTRPISLAWLGLAVATLFISVGPMYYSALGWQAASNAVPNADQSAGDLSLIAALSGVIFFCGMLSAIFSLFAACSALLILTQDYFERRRRTSPGNLEFVTHVEQ